MVSGMSIDSIETLRGLYAAPTERAVKKEIHALDRHCRRFLELSPFVVLATSDKAGNADASPRGGAPGFVKAVDDRMLLIPDAPGNNRLDTLENIVATVGWFSTNREPSRAARSAGTSRR